MSTRKEARLVKFEIKRNNETTVIWAEVPKRAFTEGKAKEGNYVAFDSDEYWKILSAEKFFNFSVFNKPAADAKVYSNVTFKESDK